MAPSILSLLPLTLLLVGKAQSVLLWKDCEEKELKQGSLECATLGVPLDYTDDGSKEIELKLARVPALIQPSMGSIMVAMTVSDSGGRSYLNGWKSYFQA